MNQKLDAMELRQLFEESGQGQVFRFWDELSEGGRSCLLARAEQIDLQEVAHLVERHVRQQGGTHGGFEDLEPAPYIAFPQHGGDAAEWVKAREAGEQALAEGRVAAFTVAGGQGTRLGYDGPKGTYPVTPVTQKSLFQVFAEKIARSAERAGAPVHWFIMTSEINHAATVQAFEEAGYFGLKADEVHFFPQGLVPAVDADGKILLSDKDLIAMTPDGHGGSLRALVRSGATAKMAELGVDCISYFQVDNPLVQCVDPLFIGFHLLGDSELSSKMVPKAYALEKVGHFCLRNGLHEVIEYSDLPAEKQEETLEDGSLRFVAGSVAIHVFSRSFVERLGGGGGGALPFHRADKKIPFVNAQGEVEKPETPNGIKFEMFVFDALPMARNPVIIEGDRSQDFSPVKNAEGTDSPQSCREDQIRMFTGWLSDAGVELDTDDSGLPAFPFEISHRFACDRADFTAQWAKLDPKPELSEGVVIGG